jgi:cation diffusion facilitator CzcD-associated flavoprotein CzcO
MAAPSTRHVKVAIAGTGFAGLGTAIRLKQEGEHDFLVFERAGDVGGVWRDNSYPGCACDVESHLYSFSFARNPGWTRAYAPSSEIWEYLRDCARRFGILPHVRFHHEVREAAWDDAAQHWRLETSGGVYTADVLVAGVGALSEPSIPKLPGIERFQGKTFHSARWDHGYALAGKNVAVIGTGASAIQFVPRIQPVVGSLRLFQRTPPWVLPRHDRALGPRTRRLMRSSRAAQWLMRASIYGRRELFALGFLHPRLAELPEKLARRYLERMIPDPVLRAKLTPSYRLGCKRVLISDDYLPSLTRDNVEVITDAIREVRAHSIVTADGVEHPVDAIIYGTGFHVTDMPIARRVRGRDGRTLDEVWRGSPQAHLGTTVAGYPNFFMLLGPNTGLGHSSVILMIESQIEHVLKALRFMRQRDLAAVEPRPEAQADWIAEVDRRMLGSVWTAGGCQSWYLDETGRNSTLWPGFTFTFKRRVERFVPEEYVAIRRRQPDARPQRLIVAEAKVANGR